MEKQELSHSTLSQDAFLMVNKKIIHALGDLNSAVLLSDLISKEKYFKNRNQLFDGWFFNTQENVKLDTGLSEYQWRKSLQLLESKGIIKTKNKGMPMTKHYQINHDLISQILASVVTTDSGLKQLQTATAVTTDSGLEELQTATAVTTDSVLEELQGNNNNLITLRNNTKEQEFSNNTEEQEGKNNTQTSSNVPDTENTPDTELLPNQEFKYYYQNRVNFNPKKYSQEYTGLNTFRYQQLIQSSSKN